MESFLLKKPVRDNRDRWFSERKITKAYCPRCDDWFRSKEDIDLIYDVGFCTLCYSDIKSGVPIILSKAEIKALHKELEEDPKVKKFDTFHLRKEMDARIVDFVAKETGVSSQDILAKNRRKEVLKARQICIFIARINGASFNKIGLVLMKDHTSVMHTFKRVKVAIASGDGKPIRLLALYKHKYNTMMEKEPTEIFLPYKEKTKVKEEVRIVEKIVEIPKEVTVVKEISKIVEKIKVIRVIEKVKINVEVKKIPQEVMDAIKLISPLKYRQGNEDPRFSTIRIDTFNITIKKVMKILHGYRF